MNNKKIFFVADAKSIHTAKWIDWFVDKEYKVYLATFALVNNTKCKNIYFLSDKSAQIDGGNYHYLFAIGKLSKVLASIKPDIINAHYSYSMGLIALLAKKRAKINSEFSVVCHGSDLLAPPKPIIFDVINKYVLKNCDKIFAVSDQIKDKLNDFKIDLEKVFVGQYGIDIEANNCVKDIDILSNRNYIPNSRIEFLLDGLKAFKDKRLNIVFVLPHVSNIKLEELRKTYPFVKFYVQIQYEEMMNMVSRAKIYVSATKSDGTSLSLLEAMDRGVIPVISNIISNRSLVLDSVNGYLFDTVEQFQDKVKTALNQDMKEIIKINKYLVGTKYHYPMQMLKIEEFLT